LSCAHLHCISVVSRACHVASHWLFCHVACHVARHVCVATCIFTCNRATRRWWLRRARHRAPSSGGTFDASTRGFLWLHLSWLPACPEHSPMVVESDVPARCDTLRILLRRTLRHILRHTSYTLRHTLSRTLKHALTYGWGTREPSLNVHGWEHQAPTRVIGFTRRVQWARAHRSHRWHR
jgi:hypothetical protein